MDNDAKANEHVVCANCSEPLTGNYCQDCGQSAHIHRSLWHMLEELLHGVFHFDNKAWRTLPALLWKPGQLTRDYINGKRASYMSPFILFLFLNFIMFFAFSYLGSNLTHDKSYKSYIKNGMVTELSNTRTKITELNSKLTSLDANHQDRAALEHEINELDLKQYGLQKTMNAINAGEEFKPNDEALKSTVIASGNTIQRLNSNESVIWFEQAIYHAIQNPELTLYKLKGAASKFAFILIPFSLPFLWLLFIKRSDIMLYDHDVFTLYSLSFMCILLILIAALVKTGLTGWALLLFLAVPPVHIFVQLRGSYQLNISAALWRTAVLLGVATFALSTYFMVITWFSVK